MELDANYWNERYLSNTTRWDLNGPSTPIKEYINQLTDKDIKILIPGCGNAYEAKYLVENGFTNVTLIDISDVLVNELKQKFKDFKNVTIINQDFFELEGEFDLILEQTFFCALNPKLRLKYVAKMVQLLNQNGKLVGLLFNTDFNNPFPPFGGSLNEYQDLFKKDFNLITLNKCYNSIPPRAGMELFIQFKVKK